MDVRGTLEVILVVSVAVEEVDVVVVDEVVDEDDAATRVDLISWK